MPQQIGIQEPPVLPSIILRYYRYPLPTLTAAGNSRFAALILPAAYYNSDFYRHSDRRHHPVPPPSFPLSPTVIPA